MINLFKRTKWIFLYSIKLYKKYNKSTDINVFFIIYRFIFYNIFYNKNILCAKNTVISGIEKIDLLGSLEIGVTPFGILHKNDLTVINIKGKFIINSSHYSIGRGSRIYIGPNAYIKLGEKGHITGFSKMIITHSLEIGDGCTIAWDCQFLDSDHQNIKYKNKKYISDGIRIGNNVWIGNGVKIYKGTKIPNGCVVASDSVVKGEFIEENTLIAGIPAKIIKRDISWSN